jgi:hypothetical protein
MPGFAHTISAKQRHSILIHIGGHARLTNKNKRTANTGQRSL